MTPEKQQITIGEACGWRRGVGSNNSGWVGEGWVFGETRRWRLNLPNYLTDLNAMHEAEKALDEKQRSAYASQLVKITGWNRSVDSVFAIAHATAAQRAEAFLRAIGRWKPSTPK